MKKKKLLLIVLIVIGVLAMLAAIGFGAYELWFDPYRGTVGQPPVTQSLDTVLTAEQALEDLDYAYERLVERHPAWLDGSDELCEAVREQYLAERAELEDGATVLELWQACGRMVTVLGDGHTYAMNVSEVALFADDFSRLRAETVTEINGEPVSDIFERFCQLYPCETREYALETFTSSVVIRKDLLALCGVDVSGGVTYTFESGEQHCSFVELSQVKGYSQETQESFVSWEIDKEHSVGLFDLDSCVCDDTYLAALDEFFAAVEKNKCETVVVDLRGNGGGNSWVANEFLRYVDVDSYMTWESYVRYGGVLVHNERSLMKNDMHDRLFSGDIYVLTDVNTYSAAMDFAMTVGDNGIGTLVGEASGNLPDSYGDCLYFSLPNSRVMLSVSYKKWSRIDPEKCGQPLEPHIVCDPKEAYEKVCDML